MGQTQKITTQNLQKHPTILTQTAEMRTAINALKDAFTEVVLKSCNFQFNHAAWRKVQELGPVPQYRENKKVRITDECVPRLYRQRLAIHKVAQ